MPLRTGSEGWVVTTNWVAAPALNAMLLEVTPVRLVPAEGEGVGPRPFR